MEKLQKFISLIKKDKSVWLFFVPACKDMVPPRMHFVLDDDGGVHEVNEFDNSDYYCFNINNEKAVRDWFHVGDHDIFDDVISFGYGK